MKQDCFDSSNYILGGKPLSCRVATCQKRAGVFGWCAEHVDIGVETEYLAEVGKGNATLAEPKCFPSHRAYREYAVLWARVDLKSGPVRHCRDCTPSHRDSMTAAGKCASPETVFVRESRAGTLAGYTLNVRNPSQWEKALLGTYGDVVNRPDQAILDDAFHDIAVNKPRPRGRPPRGGF